MQKCFQLGPTDPACLWTNFLFIHLGFSKRSGEEVVAVHGVSCTPLATECSN